MLDKKIKELIAIGASVSCNCHPCVKFHLEKAGQLGIEAKAVGLPPRPTGKGQMPGGQKPGRRKRQEQRVVYGSKKESEYKRKA